MLMPDGNGLFTTEIDAFRIPQATGAPVGLVLCDGGAAGRAALVARLRDALRLEPVDSPAFGAATAEVAVLLVDAADGVPPRTRQHMQLLALLGLRRVLLAVDHADRAALDHARFEAIATEAGTIAAALDIPSFHAVPIVAGDGGNVTDASAETPWYHDAPLLTLLQDPGLAEAVAARPFRLPVGEVARGLRGTVASGTLEPGTEVMLFPSARRSRVTEIAGAGTGRATAGQTVTLVLADDVAAAVGDVVAAATEPMERTDQFAAHVLWFGREPMLPERQYWLQIGTGTVTAVVTGLRHRVDLDTREQLSARTLRCDEVAYCNLALDQPVGFDAHKDNPATGSFQLFDPTTGAAVGAGTIHFGLRRATNLVWQDTALDKAMRSALKRQQPCVIWMTGMSGAGKSTIANLLENRLHAMGQHTYLLDGDNVRHGLNKDLGFTDADRVENIRRVAEVAKLMGDAGLIVIASFISPFRSERRMARGLMGDGEFIEVYVDAPLDVCESRDPKGLYKKARAGKIANFTGIDSPYEAPESAELHLLTADMTPPEAAERIVGYLVERGFVVGREMVEG
jgi:bifunctional enzyme CysN/CysC